MSSHTVISPMVPAESGSSGTRQAMLLRPLPGERRESVVSDSHLRPADGHGAEVLARLFPRPEANAGGDGPVGAVAGVRLGHFVIEEQIGRGGMGGVFRAVDERLNRVVALKVLAPGYARDPAAAARFRNEAQAAARLDHENISRVYYIGDDEGVPFIAFEFVRGTNVRDFILQKGFLSPAEAVNYTLQIAQALRHTQAAGVVHRDIKPSNIIITPGGHAKLVDLGLARQEQLEPARELTVPGTTLGTFDYIAPEQARDPRCVDVRADIYSLGCTLYHMLTGEPPFPQGTIIQKVVDHHRDAPPDPADRNPLTPPPLSRIVRKMMASNPDERYSGPEPLIHDLSQVALALGLRPMHVDNVVWSRPLYDPQPGFFDNNKGWLLTLAALLLIAAVIHRLPDWLPTSADLVTAGAGKNNVPTDGSLKAPAAPDEVLTEPSVMADRAPSSPDESPANGMRRGISGLSLPAFAGDPLRVATGAGDPSPVAPRPGDAAVPTASAGELAANSVDRDIEQLTSPVPDGRAPPTGNAQKPDAIAASPFVVLDALKRTEQGFATLEAACKEAPPEGLIELRFDGRLSGAQQPVRIQNKRLTIRAQRGRRPVIEFQSAAVPGQNDATQMIQLVGGVLELQNVELQMTVRSERSVLFSLVQADELQMQGVSVVVSNPDRRQSAVVEISSPDDDPQAMMPDSMRREQVVLDWQDCLIRGECDLLLSESLEPADVHFKNVAVALRGTFARIRGRVSQDGRVSDDRKLSLQFQHVTALLYDGLIRVDTGFEFDREFAPIAVQCDDSAVVVRPQQPLVVMLGSQETSLLQQRLRMRSNWSVFDVTGPVWEITQTLKGQRELLDIAALGATNLIENDLLEQPLRWDETRFPSVTEAAFRLRTPGAQSTRNSSTGVQFGDHFPPAEPIAAAGLSREAVVP